MYQLMGVDLLKYIGRHDITDEKIEQINKLEDSKMSLYVEFLDNDKEEMSWSVGLSNNLHGTCRSVDCSAIGIHNLTVEHITNIFTMMFNPEIVEYVNDKEINRINMYLSTIEERIFKVEIKKATFISFLEQMERHDLALKVVLEIP